MKKWMSLTLAAALCLTSATAFAFDANREMTVVSREDGSGTRGAFVELLGVEEKDEAGKKIGETVSSPEFQQKAQDVGKQVGDFATRTADTVAKGVGSFFGAVGKAFETVQKDLKDIEQKQKTEQKADVDKPADSDQKEGE